MKSSTYWHCCTLLHPHLYYWPAVFCTLNAVASIICTKEISRSSASACDTRAHPQRGSDPILAPPFTLVSPYTAAPSGSRSFKPSAITQKVLLEICTDVCHDSIKAPRDPISSILCTEVKNFDRHVLDLRDMGRMKGGIYFKHCAWHCVLFCPRSFSAKALLS